MEQRIRSYRLCEHAGTTCGHFVYLRSGTRPLVEARGHILRPTSPFRKITFPPCFPFRSCPANLPMKRSADSRNQLATELALKWLNILMMNYIDQFMQHQRLQVSVLNATPAVAYLPLQTLESRQLMYDLLHHAGGAGADVQAYFHRTTASIIHTLLCGFRIRDLDDRALSTVVKLNDEFSDFVQVGAHIVDQFSVLNNLPSSWLHGKPEPRTIIIQSTIYD